MKREVENVYDFKAFGQAIKKARRAAGYSRKRLGHELNLAPRYLVSIENEGQGQQFSFSLDTILCSGGSGLSESP